MNGSPGGGWPTSTDFDEDRACYVLEQALQVKVCRTDRRGEGGDGRTDLAFDLPDGRGIAEVVSTRRPRAESLAAAVAHPRYTPVDELRRLWFVVLEPSPLTRVSDLRAMLPERLRELEHRDVDQASSPGPLRRSGATIDLPGVRRCFATEPTETHPPGYMLMEAPGVAPGDGGPVHGDGVLDRIEAFLAGRPDKAAKLDREADLLRQVGTEVAHRHLVLLLEPVAGWHEAAVRGFLYGGDDGAPGLQAPALQDGVTGLWLLPLQSFPPTDDVLRWTAESGRWDLARVPVQPDGWTAVCGPDCDGLHTVR